MPPFVAVWIASSLSLLAMTSIRIPAAGSARVVRIERPSSSRGSRECRAFCTPVVSCAKVESTRGRHHRHAETSGIPCAMGYGLFRALPGVPGLLAAITRELVHELDPSVGGSGPHDFTVRAARLVVARIRVHRIPLPTFVTTRTPLLPEQDGRQSTTSFRKTEDKYFCRKDLT